MLRSSRSSSGRCSSGANVEALNGRSSATRLPWQSRSPLLLIIHRRSDAFSFSTLIPRGRPDMPPQRDGVDDPAATIRCSSKENEHDQLLHASRHHPRAGAAIDVFDSEPMPTNHPFLDARQRAGDAAHRLCDRRTLSYLYGDAAASIAAWLEANAARALKDGCGR